MSYNSNNYFYITEKINQLCSDNGVSGNENNITQKLKTILQEYSNDVITDDFNNVYCFINNHKTDLPLLMLEAHLDEIGMIVTSIDNDGFVKVSNIGGLDRRLLSAQEVIIHGKEDIFGVIGSVPPHLNKSEIKTALQIDEVFIDIGYTKQEAEKLISLGDRVSFKSNIIPLLNDKISSKALDNRIGVISILQALKLLKETNFNNLNYRIAVLFSAQEEVNHSGVRTATYKISPDIALCVDVGYGLTLDSPEHRCGKLNNGVMIGIAPILDKNFSQKLKDIAIKKDIPYQMDIMNNLTHTDADDIIVSKSGTKASLLSIPLKYMHTPIEVCALEDVFNTGKLIAEFICMEDK